MLTKSYQTTINLFFDDQPEVSIFNTDNFKRTKQFLSKNCFRLIDSHLKFRVQICHLNINSGNTPEEIIFFIQGNIRNIHKSSEHGFLLNIDHNTRRFTVWFPTLPKLFRLETNHRLAMAQNHHPKYQWKCDSQLQLSILRPQHENETVMFSYLVIEDESNWLTSELISDTDLECRFYRKSDWFFAQRPLDIWNYLINGSLYDPRTDVRVNKRFICQQCAYSWWSYFGYLHRETDKRIYDVLQNEVAYAVLLDMKDNGEWGHGYWSDEIETHARFHLDGIHLLLAQFEKTGESFWLNAAEQSFGFVQINLMEQLDDGSLWFLHDTIEHTRHHRFCSTLLGKTPGNSLCLNTHVQALIVLYRLQLISFNSLTYQRMFNQGLSALKRVLEYHPGEWLYGVLMPWVLRSKTRKFESDFWNNIGKILWRFFARNVYWIIRRKYPRLAFSNGFIERDLTLSWAADNYHIGNLKDFLILYRQNPSDWLCPFIEKGVEYARSLDLALALKFSPYYIEWMDILYMYDKFIQKVSLEEMKSVEDIIRETTGGYSLDYFASELVRDKR